jgi:hypothetical protein
MATTKTKRELEAENDELRRLLASKNGDGPLTYRVSQRGAVSVYGLMRFPVTLYQNQWELLFQHEKELKQFIKDNQGKLAVKKS